MPHLLGPAGQPPPPTRNELLLREAVDRLRAQLDECRTQRDDNLANARRIDDLRMAEIREVRSVIALHQQNGCGVQLYAEGRQAEVDRLHAQLNAARQVVEAVRIEAERIRGTRSENWTVALIDTYDQLTKEPR